MKTLSSEYNFYTYLEVGIGEDYKKCVKKLIDKMKQKKYRYNPDEFGDWRNEPQDEYGDGRCGSPMYFVKY
jgi:hypothetical protein